MNIAVLVSGSGTNLQKIIDAISSNVLKDTTIKYVIADRDCFAIKRVVEDINIQTYQLMRGKTLSSSLHEILQNNVDYIVMAGFLSILNKEFCTIYKNKIINIHPSLLPKYGGEGMYGNRVHKAVIDNNETESGATVHFVTEVVDGGEIIVQGKCDVDTNDTIETLAKKVHNVEYKILIEALIKLEIEK